MSVEAANPRIERPRHHELDEVLRSERRQRDQDDQDRDHDRNADAVTLERRSFGPPEQPIGAHGENERQQHERQDDRVEGVVGGQVGR